MELVTEMIPFHNFPELVGNLPMSAVPLVLNALAVLVPTNALERTPRPARLFEIMVVLPHLPELALHTPFALHIALDNAVPVPVETHALVRTPGLANLPV